MTKPTYEQLEKERDELAAQVERLRKLVMDKTAQPVCCNRPYSDNQAAHICCGSPDFTWPDDVVAVLSETPPAALTALKAQWQAEALECCVESMRARGYSESNAAMVQAVEAIAEAKGEL